MADEIVVTTALAAGSYVATKLFGPVIDTMGDDINKLYAKGRDKVFGVAVEKIPDQDDGKKVNVRAARDVLWNGAISEDEVCAEYFGGMLASSRSEDGKDDSVLNYLDAVKGLSSRQLELHYVIYQSFQRMFRDSNTSINVALGTSLSSHPIYLSGGELKSRNLEYDRNLTVLSRQGLIGNFKYDAIVVGDAISGEDATQVGEGITVGKLYIEYANVLPTTYGILLFCAAHNKLDDWREFCKNVYESATEIKPLNYFNNSLEGLTKRILDEINLQR